MFFPSVRSKVINFVERNPSKKKNFLLVQIVSCPVDTGQSLANRMEARYKSATEKKTTTTIALLLLSRRPPAV